MAREEYKPEKVYEDVYVATLTKDDQIILQDRGYKVIATIPIRKTAGYLMGGVCLCQYQKNWYGQPDKPIESESYWFCLDRNTNKRATAEVWEDEEGKYVVEMKQPGSSCEA